jgi:phosphoribosylglycinamide formyltransferase-1
MKKIAIFASGSGTNAENISNFFAGHESITIDCILTNKADAFVLERAKRLGIASFVFNRDSFYGSFEVLDYLKEREVDFIVLSGFLWLVPDYLIKHYPNNIINIHPALLPKYGGKGMYGYYVHKAVVEAGEKESGISIHYVNERYDEGNIIFQAKCKVESEDKPEDVARKVHKLEYEHFPRIIEQILLS